MRRKFLSVVLCVCMMLTMAPFAFAEGETTESATTNQSSNSSGSGSGTVTPTVGIATEDALKKAISDASDNATIKLDNDITLTSTLNITKNITLNGDGHTISGSVASGTSFINVSIPNDGDFTLTNCKIVPTDQVTPNAAISLSVAGKVTVTDCTFGASNDTAGHMYNGLEFSQTVPMGDTTITGNTFYGGAFRHNCISFYRMNDNATININNNNFSNLNWDKSNAIRVSNYGSNTATINLNGNIYSDHGSDANQSYAGLLLFQNPKNHTDDFTKLTVNISNLSTASTSQLFYIYDDINGIITTNQPIIKGDSSIAKFFSARIGDTYYKTLADAYAALPRNVGANSTPTTITVLKDSDGEAIGSDSDKDMNYVIDFNGHTYTVGKPTVGSTGTETQGLRVLKGSTAVFKNGTLKAANYQNMKMPVHTYGDVTFQDFTVDAREDSYASVAYEIDNGSLEMLGNSSILAYSGKTGLYVAFWPRGNYVDGTTVTINTTGKITGKLVYEWDDVADISKQQTENKAVLKIENGNFAITGIETLFTNSIPSNLKVPKIFISGGYFTTDPTAYLATGKTAVESDLAGYNYKVADKTSTPATVAAATPTVDTSKISETQQQTATEIANQLKADNNTVSGDGLTAAASTIANNNTVTTDQGKTALNDQNISAETSNTRIVVQTYMDIDITAIDSTSDKKTLTLDITPMYRTVATTATNDAEIILAGSSTTGEANAVPIGPANKLVINKPVTVKIPLPTNFVTANNDGSYSNVYVQHKGHEYTATVTQDTTSNKLIATFTNPDGFSEFTISKDPATVATIGQNRYTTLQDAINAVKDNETIEIVGSSKTLTATVSGNKTFTVNANSNTVTLTAASGYNMTSTPGDTTGITTYTVSHHSSGGPGSSGGSISAPTTYAVNVNAATNGAVAADKKTASKGTTVTVTASPSKGYVVDAVKVVDKDGKDVAVTEKDGKYVFTMPASAVTVTGSFKAETPAPVALPFTDVKSGNWFYDAVKYAYAQGLMTGTSATTFAPNGTMNRAMIVTVLYRLEKSPAVTGASKFTDVPAGQWYSDAVAWAAANKIVNGYDETTFGPMNAVTREQMAAILFRYEQVKGLENVTLEENLNRFPDQNKISAYAIPALQWAVGQKIINGNADGTLDPTGTATRAQVAQIFTNLLNK